MTIYLNTVGVKAQIRRRGGRELRKFAGVGELQIGILPNAQDYPTSIEGGGEKGQLRPAGFVSQVVLVAYVHEKGLPLGRGGKPSRYKKWLTKAVEEDERVYKESVRKILKHAGKNLTKKKIGLEVLGGEAVPMVRKNVDQNTISLPSNRPATQEAKGGDTPMVDTKHLVQQIDYMVEKVTHGRR